MIEIDIQPLSCHSNHAMSYMNEIDRSQPFFEGKVPVRVIVTAGPNAGAPFQPLERPLDAVQELTFRIYGGYQIKVSTSNAVLKVDVVKCLLSARQGLDRPPLTVTLPGLGPPPPCDLSPRSNQATSRDCSTLRSQMSQILSFCTPSQCLRVTFRTSRLSRQSSSSLQPSPRNLYSSCKKRQHLTLTLRLGE